MPDLIFLNMEDRKNISERKRECRIKRKERESVEKQLKQEKVSRNLPCKLLFKCLDFYYFERNKRSLCVFLRNENIIIKVSIFKKQLIININEIFIYNKRNRYFISQYAPNFSRKYLNTCYRNLIYHVCVVNISNYVLCKIF